MEEKDKLKKENIDDDDKIHVTKSVLQTANELQQKQAEEDELKRQELEKKIAEREKKKREAHDKRLAEEKRELLKLKQGIIEESETIHEEQEEEIKLTFFQKIGNFFYHNKWWLGMGVFVVIVFVYLIANLISRPRPDMAILFIGENEIVGEQSELADYVASFADDFNGNGEVFVSIYYIPYTENEQKNYANGVDTKLTAELQSAESVIVIGNNLIDKVLNPEEVFVNLEELYPDNQNVDGWAFMLEDTAFAERIGVDESYIKDGMFLALRTPRNLAYSKLSDMQETYERDFPVFDSIINDLSE